MRASLKGIGDLACWPLLDDGWMVEAGGLRDVKVAGRGRRSPQMSLTKLKRRPPEARDP
jgi:hypothetical protein